MTMLELASIAIALGFVIIGLRASLETCRLLREHDRDVKKRLDIIATLIKRGGT